MRKLAEGGVTCDLFAFLTCEPNAEVGAVHPKAMPVILTKADEIEMWLRAPWTDARSLQRPLRDGVLQIVAQGDKQDPPAAREGSDVPAALFLKKRRNWFRLEYILS